MIDPSKLKYRLKVPSHLNGTSSLWSRNNACVQRLYELRVRACVGNMYLCNHMHVQNGTGGSMIDRPGSFYTVKCLWLPTIRDEL